MLTKLQQLKKYKISKDSLMQAIFVISFVLLFTILAIWEEYSVKEPIYYRYLVQHYLPTISESLYEPSTIELMYLTDITDGKKVTNVTFIDHPELKVKVIGENTEQYGLYKRVRVVLYMDWNPDVVDALPEVAEVNKILVDYSNETSQEVDIGSLYIYSGQTEKKLLKGIDAIPLWDSERVQVYQVNKTIMFQGFSELSQKLLNEADIIDFYSLDSKQHNLLDLTMPIKLERDEEIVFNMTIKGPYEKRLLTLNSKYDYYELEPKLIFYDESGTEYFSAVNNQWVSLEFETFKDVREYIKSRNEVDDLEGMQE